MFVIPENSPFHHEAHKAMAHELDEAYVQLVEHPATSTNPEPD